MTYDVLGAGALDYLPCHYGASKLVFRGPRRDLGAPYVAFLGGTQTFGKFIEQPYPLKVEHLTGVTSVNLGQVNAGVEVYEQEAVVHEIAQGARVTVVEVLGAVNASNLFYAVHPRRNDRFLRASRQLKQLYPEVDFTQFHFTQHLVSHLQRIDADRFLLVRRMLQRGWIRRMRQLLKKLGGPVVLLRLGADRSGNLRCGGIAPVTDNMIDALGPVFSACVEMPDNAGSGSGHMQGMVYNLLEEDAAKQLPGPEFHSDTAETLSPVLDRLM
ncbi:DUF6473 family protein [Sulfitobacter sp. F26169L]|uniref:DUF6473 family protein n=1 Tax=Sulfitobacter sp. F26169L TaxID=2996015 RepID=UPI00226085F8|nr:DUF6473 family protein [Sulfitobacter sp. F26169L]MCX7566792.1 DUF6473 family protein [Sulfitobacter sp. F26169L]